MRTAFRRAGQGRWTRRIVLAWIAVVATGAAVIVRDGRELERHVELIALERATTLFDLVASARAWNARSGGVYVPVTPDTPPNPHLKVPRRDVTTLDGQSLTLINPAYMTRQIGELAAQGGAHTQGLEGLNLHITSLRPTRPENAADPWEAAALRAFEAGETRRLELVAEGPAGEPVHRYMAPLVVEQPCLKCHADQGYAVGDIRGGVSVTMPARQLLALAETERLWSIFVHGSAFGLLGLLLHWVLRAQQRHVGALEALNVQQGESLEEQGRALLQANRELAAEVERRRRDEEILAAAERRYRALVETSPDGMAMTDGDRIVLANRRLAEMLATTPEALRGRTIAELVHPGDRERLPGTRVDVTPAPGYEPAPDCLRLAAADHRPVHIELRVGAGLSLAGDTPAVMYTFRDMTERLQAELDRQMAAAYFEGADHGVMVTDAENRIIRVNPAFSRLTGYAFDDVVGRTPKLFQSGRHDAAFYRRMWEDLHSTGHWAGEIWNRRKDGGVYAEWLSITVVRDPAGRIVDHVAMFHDITERKHAEEKVRHRATHDALTDLPNRALFAELAENALAAATRYGRRMAVLCVDLDRFKQVNDTFGHAAGDEVLRETARRLLGCVREADVVARVGGDELQVLLPQVADEAGVEQIAARICAALAQPFALAGAEARLGASVGIALAPDHGADVKTLFARADQAMYAAKAGGRGTWRMYRPDLEAAGG